MVYVNPLDPATPAATDPVGQGDDRMREIKAAVIERLESVFADVDADPMVLLDVNIGSLTPTSADRDLGTTGAPFRDLWLSRLLSIVSTAAIQATIGYDASNRLDISVGSGGGVTFNSVGTTPQFTFSDQLVVNSGANPAFAAIGTTGVQASIRYDSTHRLDLTVSAAGLVTYTAVGASAAHTFVNPVVLTQGTLTADTEALSSTATWNNAAVTFTHWLAAITDTASATASKLVEFTVGGASKFAVTKAGVLSLAGSASVISTGANSLALDSLAGESSYTVTIGQSVGGSFSSVSLSLGAGGASGSEEAYVVLRGRSVTGVQGITFTDLVGTNWLIQRSPSSVFSIASAAGTAMSIAAAASGALTLGSTGNRQVIIEGSGWGAGAASLRLNGLTSGAGAGAGTLTNAPSAGNPAFWVPISIAGTVRYLPAW